MRKSFLATIAIAALAAAPAYSWMDSTGFSWSGRLSNGQTIEVKGVNGDIIARKSDSGEVRVTADKKGRDADKVKVEIVEHDGGVTLCAVYPTPPGADKPNECVPGKGGRMNTRNTKASVRFNVDVPTGSAWWQKR